RSVVVTGGTGALGRAVVEAFVAARDRVVVPWIVPAGAEALRAAWREALAAKQVVLLEADVAEEAGAARAVAEAGAVGVPVTGGGGFGGGGVFGGGAPVDATELALWDRMYRMNLRTAAACARAALPGMRARARGVIVNVASQAAFSKPAGLAAYAASKAGVVVLTQCL